MLENKRYKRSQYLVSKKFQLKYVGIILLFMFLTAALCSYVIYYTMMMLMGEKLANVYPQGRLVSIVNIVNFRIMLSMVLVTPLVAIIGIVLSHRIAGPIYRMEKFLKEMASGNLTSRIALRSKDELVVVANGINSLADGLALTVRRQKASLTNAVNELENIKTIAQSKPANISAITSNINNLENEIKDLTKELDKYKI